MSGAVVGTPQYMAPEQAWGKIREMDRRTDVYSLGATLYELLSERPPFEGNTTEVLRMVTEVEATPPRKIKPSIPVDLETIVLKCMEKEPQRRCDSARFASHPSAPSPPQRQAASPPQSPASPSALSSRCSILPAPYSNSKAGQCLTHVGTGGSVGTNSFSLHSVAALIAMIHLNCSGIRCAPVGC